MKRKTYNFWSHVPIVGYLINTFCLPNYCSFGREDGTYDAVFAYAKAHPDIIVTKKIFDKIMKGELK